MSYSIRTSEMGVPLLVAWKLVLPRRFLDLQRIAVRPAIAIVTISVSFLQELLVLDLQVVFEDDAVDVRALITEAVGFLHVGAVELRVMLQLTWLWMPAGKAWRSRVLIQATRVQQSRPSFVNVTTV